MLITAWDWCFQHTVPSHRAGTAGSQDPLLGLQAVPGVCAIRPRPHSAVTRRDQGCCPSAWPQLGQGHQNLVDHCFNAFSLLLDTELMPNSKRAPLRDSPGLLTPGPGFSSSPGRPPAEGWYQGCLSPQRHMPCAPAPSPCTVS